MNMEVERGPWQDYYPSVVFRAPKDHININILVVFSHTKV